ncbi:MAG: extracellular solute-binding protein [Bacillota bacterium]
MRKLSAFLLRILILAVLAAVLPGCRGDTSGGNQTMADDSPGESVIHTIRVASTFTREDPYSGVWQQVLEEFAAEHPGIKVIDEATGAGADAFKIKINTDFASGNEPDVTYGFNGALGKPLVDSGKVITWEEELESDPEWASNFMPDPLETCKFNGRLYALPFLGFFEGMWINRDLFEKCGLDIPRTYEDIIEAIPVLRENDIIPIVCAFSDEPHYIIETFLLSTGGREGHANPFDPSWPTALNLIKNLYDMKAFSDDALTIKQSACVELFVNKKAAMFISGSWSRGSIKDYENTIVVPLPLVPGGKADPTDIIGGAGTGWYLTRELNEKKDGAGMKFIKYMTRPEVVAKFVDVAGVPCINCEVKARSPMEQSCIDLVNNAKSINGAVGDMLGQEVFGSIWRGLSHIVTGRKTPEQVLDEARKLVKD